MFKEHYIIAYEYIYCYKSLGKIASLKAPLQYELKEQKQISFQYLQYLKRKCMVIFNSMWSAI